MPLAKENELLAGSITLHENAPVYPGHFGNNYLLESFVLRNLGVKITGLFR